MEVWKEIKGWEGFYSISDAGGVKSMTRSGISKRGVKFIVKEKILTKCFDSDGYEIVVFSRNGIHYNRKVHRLVISAFKENTENKSTVNHINGIKKDNRLDNLEYATIIENHRHALKYIRTKGPNTGRFGKLSKSSKPVIVFMPNGESKQFVGQCEAARELGINQ